MNRSILLLIGLFVLLIGGMAFTNIQLQAIYDKIDKSDQYYAFETTDSLSFKFIRIEGGNIAQIPIATEDETILRVHSEYKEDVTYHTDKDTLIISFSEDLTFGDEAGIYYSYPQITPVVQISCPELVNLDMTNGAVDLTLNNQTDIRMNLHGNSEVTIHSTDGNLDYLNYRGHDKSKLILDENSLSKIGQMNLQLYETSFAELHNIEVDSLVLKMENEARISAGSTFFK